MDKRFNRFLSAAMGLFLLAASICAQAAPERGTFTFTHPENDKRIVVFYVRSESYDPGTPPVLVLHGMSRNPWDYRDAWIDLANQYNFLVVVPYFREKEFPGTVGYNLGNVFQSETHLSRNPESDWSYRIPEVVFDHLRATGKTSAPGYAAFGHSAGSQFLHRKIGFAPDSRLLLAVAANAGWYTLPDLEEPWPYGYGGTGLTDEDLPPYLASNLVILLGDGDTDLNDDSLRRAPEAMRQGKHRLERGGYFFRAAEERAQNLGVPFNWRIQEVPGVGHNNAGMAPAAAEIMREYIRNRKDTVERD